MDDKFVRKIVSLDSKKRQYGSNNKPQFVLQYPIRLKKGSIFRLSSSNLPQTFKTVSSSLGNNSFLFEEDDVNSQFTVTIPGGRYTNNSLANQLQTSINLLLVTSSSVTVSYSSTTGRMTFTSDGVIDIALNLNSNAAFARLIGFEAQNTGFDQSFEGSYVVQTDTIPYIYLRSPELMSLAPSGQQHGLEGQNDLNLFRFDLINSNYARTQFNNNNKEQIFKCQGQLKIITLEFFDSDNNSIDFQGSNFVIDIEFLSRVT